MATIKTSLSRLHAISAAIVHDGTIMLANGLDAPQRWDGQTAASEDAGLDAPSTVLTATTTRTSGTIWGQYRIYSRYVDDAGIPSSFSTLTSLSITSGAKVTGLRYANVPQPSGRATKTEIWRNTRGQIVSYYLDVADASATGKTLRTDGSLILQSAIRYLTPEGWPNALRFTPPPSWASVVVSFQNRTWWAVPVDYTYGDATVSTSTTYVKITGARLTSEMAARNLYASGFKGAVISSIDSNTALTLTASPTVGFGTAGSYYSIATDAANYNTVLFSEAGEPEAVPADNAIQLQEDGDRLTGMLPLGSYLFMLKERHIYRLSSAGDPRRDAIALLASRRGCVNQRCWTLVQGAAFILDRQGCYLFDGSTPTPVSAAIDDWFRDRINWDAAKWFHVEHSPEDQTVRCFVAVDNDYWPQDVFSFNYQLGQWHHERYPYMLGASAAVPIRGQERTLVGMEDSVSLLSEGVLDGPSPGLASHETKVLSVSQTTRGTVTGATTTTIVASAATLDFSSWHASPQSIGAPVYVIDTSGDYQVRRIASVNSTSKTITVQTDWTTTPSSGDTFQIGGIEYQGKWGSFELPEDEVRQVRRVLLRFKPQSKASKVNVRRYYDHTSSVETAHIAYSDAVGVDVAASSGNAQMDLTRSAGVLETRFDEGFEPESPAQRSLEVELKGVSGNQRSEFFEIVVNGVKR